MATNIVHLNEYLPAQEFDYIPMEAHDRCLRGAGALDDIRLLYAEGHINALTALQFSWLNRVPVMPETLEAWDRYEMEFQDA